MLGVLEQTKTKNTEISQELEISKTQNSELQSQLVQTRITSKLQLSKLQKELRSSENIEASPASSPAIITLADPVIDNNRILDLEQILIERDAFILQKENEIKQYKSEIETLKTSFEDSDKLIEINKLIEAQETISRLSTQLSELTSTTMLKTEHETIIKKLDAENIDTDSIFKNEMLDVSKTLTESRQELARVVKAKNKELLLSNNKYSELSKHHEKANEDLKGIVVEFNMERTSLRKQVIGIKMKYLPFRFQN